MLELFFFELYCQFSHVSLLYHEQTFHTSLSVFSVEECFNKRNVQVFKNNINNK